MEVVSPDARLRGHWIVKLRLRHVQNYWQRIKAIPVPPAGVHAQGDFTGLNMFSSYGSFVTGWISRHWLCGRGLWLSPVQAIFPDVGAGCSVFYAWPVPW